MPLPRPPSTWIVRTEKLTILITRPSPERRRCDSAKRVKRAMLMKPRSNAGTPLLKRLVDALLAGASRLNSNPPTVSRQLAALERELKLRSESR